MYIKLSCSKETNLKISGIYKLLEKKGKYKEKTYCKLDKSLFIYKVSKTKYVISTRLYSQSYRVYVNVSKLNTLFTKNTWHIYHGNNLWIIDNVIVEELNEYTETSNEITTINKIPSDILIIYSKYNNIAGGYKKLVKKCYGSIAYYNEEDELYLYTLRSFFSQFWVIGNKLGSYSFYIKSDNFEQLPENSSFESSKIIIKPYIEHELYNNINNEKQFIDTEFKADLHSIGKGKIIENYKNITWIRAVNLQPMFSKMVLFSGIEPNDIMQGCIGDCWLLAAFASVAEFPNYIKTKIFKTKKISKIGKYEINLFDCSKNKWITVTLDDRIPCMEKIIYAPPRPLFSQPHENEMYILLLEKAFAKMAGSYTRLDGGFPALCWIALLGCQNVEYWVKNDSNWNKSIIIGNKSEPWNFQKVTGYSTNVIIQNNAMFNYLKDCDTKNYVMSCAIHGDIMEKKRDDGFIERHAYSLIHVYRKNNIKLICIRNPWGRVESTLDWSDNSRKWEEHIDIAKEVNFTIDDDGKFWVSWEDFLNIFDEVQIACKSL